MSVRVDKKGETLFLTWDRPPLNVLDIAVLRQFGETLDSCAKDPAAQIVVLQGAGERAFSAGMDVADHTPDKAPAMLEAVHGVVRQLLALPQVTIALIRGLCLGGGCEIASCCDFLIASDKSSFATPEIHVGCYPPVALARFPALIGYHRAAEMILTGRRFSAQEALAMGLINRVLPTEQLESGLEALLDELRGKSGAVLRLAVKGLRELSLKTFSEDLERSETLYRNELLRTQDAAEGVRAFLEKRRPRWYNR
jgi:cyclohexa-1,5-dienecarbonyl-CoA hydratase